MSFEREFEQNMKQLMLLLKKIMGQYSMDGKSPAEMMKFLRDMKDKSPDVNIFFLNMSPLSPEEFDEIEEMFESGAMSEYLKSGELKCELNADDHAFLKRHGIRF
jgi:sugar-specific transcriptional regulator TrmB